MKKLEHLEFLKNFKKVKKCDCLRNVKKYIEGERKIARM